MSRRLTLGVSLRLGFMTTLAWAGPVRRTTYEEKTLNRLQTLCDDGTRAVSTWSPTLQRWETTITPPPRTPSRTCTPQTTSRGLAVRCR